jgi:hypothetical protein
MIVQANIKATPESIEELIELYGGVRQAWYQAELESRVNQTQADAPATNQPGEAAVAGAASPANEDIDKPQLQWSA